MILRCGWLVILTKRAVSVFIATGFMAILKLLWARWHSLCKRRAPLLLLTHAPGTGKTTNIDNYVCVLNNSEILFFHKLYRSGTPCLTPVSKWILLAPSRRSCTAQHPIQHRRDALRGLSIDIQIQIQAILEWNHFDQGHYLLSGKTSCCQISWNLEAARLDIIMIVLLYL